MSQSGTTISPRRRLLKDTEAICIVWSVGSWGIKSSDALATALFIELSSKNPISTFFKQFEKTKTFRKIESCKPEYGVWIVTHATNEIIVFKCDSNIKQDAEVSQILD